MSSLTWSKTGDSIQLRPINHGVYDYFIEQLNKRSINHYTMPDLGYSSFGKELEHELSLVQQLSRDKFKSLLFDFDFEFDSSNQTHLNSLHRHWVKAHQKFPSISKLFDMQTPGSLYKINKLIHAIEISTYDFAITSCDTTQIFANPFGTTVLKHGTFNLAVRYDNLGRSSYNKWLNGDISNDTDTNNFSEFYTTLDVKIVPSSETSALEKYQQWCNKYKIACVGSQMPLANFDKLDDNLLQCRQLFLKNSLIENNFITLE
jgi:hypothetical protein